MLPLLKEGLSASKLLILIAESGGAETQIMLCKLVPENPYPFTDIGRNSSHLYLSDVSQIKVVFVLRMFFFIDDLRK